MNSRSAVENQPKKVRISEEIMCDSCQEFLLEEEVEALWFTREELKAICLRCRHISLGGKIDSEEETIRGLEPNHPEIRATRNATIHHFLVEQEVQLFVDGEQDDEALANILRSYSSHRQRVARSRGMKDAKAVLGIASASDDLCADGENRKLRRTERRTRTARMA
jgi:hypothetical protein